MPITKNLVKKTDRTRFELKPEDSDTKNSIIRKPFYKWLEKKKVPKFIDAIEEYLPDFDVYTQYIDTEDLQTLKATHNHFWFRTHKGL